MMWTHDEQALAFFIHMGTVDRIPEDRPWDASTRAMRHSSIMAERLWSLLETERERVRLVFGSFPPFIDCSFQGDRLERSLAQLHTNIVEVSTVLTGRVHQLDEELQTVKDRLRRHRIDINLLYDDGLVVAENARNLSNQVTDLSGRVCRCNTSSESSVGEGTRERPFELEYAADDEYVPIPPAFPVDHSPATPPVTVPPLENTSPIPVPSPSVVGPTDVDPNDVETPLSPELEELNQRMQLDAASVRPLADRIVRRRLRRSRPFKAPAHRMAPGYPPWHELFGVGRTCCRGVSPEVAVGGGGDGGVLLRSPPSL